MSLILEGLDGVLYHMDDVLVYGANKAEHDARLTTKEDQSRTLNSEKCDFEKERIKFLGQIMDGNGIRADPEKTSAIRQVEA